MGAGFRGGPPAGRRSGIFFAVWLAALVALCFPDPVWARPTAEREPPRVRQAREKSGKIVRELFHKAGVDYPPQQLFLRVFKSHGDLEVWAGKTGQPLKRIAVYPVCSRSGELGPKRKQGDGQVPEGVYRIDHFNPWSNFHLSLRVSYPNPGDRKRGQQPLGGDIFIHGSCVTIGCVPIEDDGIRQVYLMAWDFRRSSKEPIVTHIFPRPMDEAGMAALRKESAGGGRLWGLWREATGAGAANRDELWTFWNEELRPIYEAFERTRTVPAVRIDPRTGAYQLVPRR
ncbi:MAG: hypothetical protein GMKNLPBB_00525 [Myxococcota bacterium]|nr:hypothetical protein [Myxococcota bacterium]